MAERRRRTGRGRSDDDIIRYIRLAAIPIVIVLVLAAVIILMDKKPSQEAGVTAQTEEQGDEPLEFEIHGDKEESTLSPEGQETEEEQVASLIKLLVL